MRTLHPLLSPHMRHKPLLVLAQSLCLVTRFLCVEGVFVSPLSQTGPFTAQFVLLCSACEFPEARIQ